MQLSEGNYIWAKLVPQAKDMKTYPLKNKKIVIGRTSGDIIIS